MMCKATLRQRLTHIFGRRRRLLSTAATSTTTPALFDKILVANRGEIVERVIRTCQELDIETVAVHSTADSKARFARLADERVCIGPSPAADSYLQVPNILEAARRTGAQAIHPGYGFLSENAGFAQAVEDAGLEFLGPAPSAIRQLGDKLESKLLADAAGVSTVPGFEGQVESLDQAVALCQSTVPYPVLLKAAAGGGGKGMRICRNEAELVEAWGLTKAEALSFFKDDRLLLEKYIENPHHIEFQVLADGHGQVVVFPERECSIQRRNQKILEESPSVLLTEETRQAMAEQVRQLCHAVSYRSAGTVEFLVSPSSTTLGLQDFYFLEMNTRLQVEHPVTEAVCGVDLVKAMLYVGAGRGLPEELQLFGREGVMPHRGHALEARLYAEDPQRGFVPSTGPLVQYAEPGRLTTSTTPVDASYIRLDGGVEAGTVVSPYYDPMLSKLISYAPSRMDSIQGLAQALDEYVVQGVQHNAQLVQSLLRHPAFQSGDTSTSFLEQHYPDGFSGVELTEEEQEEFAVVAAVLEAQQQAWLQQPRLPGQTNDDVVMVRFGGMFGELTYQVRWEGDQVAQVTKVDENDEGDAPSPHRTIPVSDLEYDPARFLATVPLGNSDGSVTKRVVQVLHQDVSTGCYRLQMHGCDQDVLVQSRREYELSRFMLEPPVPDTHDLVASPMPGTLIRYAVEPGDVVQVGQELCIVEAMKMQNVIRSPRHGVIAECSVDEGSSLMADAVLLRFVAEDDEEELENRSSE